MLEIISEAERSEYDLIVMGATAVSNSKQSMLGSVEQSGAGCALLSFVAKFIE